jgi:hypothetical protein
MRTTFQAAKSTSGRVSGNGGQAQVQLSDELSTGLAAARAKVVPQALCTRPADMQLRTDHTDGGNLVCRKLLGEHLDGLFL